MAAAKPSLGRLLPGSSILFLCDMQEKFRHVAYFPQIVSVAARMLKVARLLEVPTVLTEQYPQGLGPTVPELGAEGLRPLAKTCFSMVPVARQELDARPQLRSVLLCGIEAQVCILRPSPQSPVRTRHPVLVWARPSPLSAPEHSPGPHGSGAAGPRGGGRLLLPQPGGPPGGTRPDAAERRLPLHQRRAHPAARGGRCAPPVQGDPEDHQGARPGQRAARPLPRPEPAPPLTPPPPGTPPLLSPAALEAPSPIPGPQEWCSPPGAPPLGSGGGCCLAIGRRLPEMQMSPWKPPAVG
ncbi:isochorismatase domain-containing protein 2 isoform X1 [Pipistrellus kuhlii]|uniref:Isochorismatase domain containing 2 n=1 Tax=Pipistrellus kuhlii TaxID=59472 RepID=A0A7J7QV14_PIPKU|nr:isochorismatase domain-containing protein 2 isoform X1 [Pipistrellus kuhlii]XP_045437147.1 isochorismatase domain-containing protein 2 isoform X1 [Pipistrellus kuhlii]XP_045437148.1 isochorismatase domain-containing protein 2 isoform X1 [Pipistrellus kuhlii]KAF6267676.1 isochorismatase domain containing 2 [Pipistrellus kuhlii]